MTASSDGAAHAELWSLYESWFALIAAENQSFFRRILSDDWHYTSFRGEVRGKTEYLDYIASIRAEGPVNELVDLVVRPFGRLTVVHGTYIVADGFAPPEGAVVKFTAVWERRGDGWFALAHHATIATGSE